MPSTSTVCFPARVAWSRVLTGAHTHASGEHPVLIGVFQILRMSLSRSLRLVVVVVFVAVGYRLPNSSGFPFVHFDLEKVSPPWLNF